VASCDGVFLSGSLPLCEIIIVLVVTDMANKLLSLSLLAGDAWHRLIAARVGVKANHRRSECPIPM